MAFVSSYLFFFDLPNLSEILSFIKKGIYDIRLSDIIYSIKALFYGNKLSLGDQDTIMKSEPIIGNSKNSTGETGSPSPDNSGLTETGSANPDNSGLALSDNNDSSTDDNHNERSDSDSDPGYADNQNEYDNLDLGRDMPDNPLEADDEMKQVSNVIEGNQAEAHYHKKALKILEKSSDE
jgi:hypothetical protein